MPHTPRAKSRPADRLVLRDVDWVTYTRLLHAFAEYPGTRLTYDRGVLEIMSPSHAHDSDSAYLSFMVLVLIEELRLAMKVAGSTTLRRRLKQRGLEPDQSFWIANEPKVRGKRKINLRVDPPPDLAIEINATRSSLNRMGIYASLGVPEVWRLTRKGMTFNALQPDGSYKPVSNSLSFPLLTPADLTSFLALRSQLEETEVLRQFRAWVRQRQAGPAPQP